MNLLRASLVGLTLSLTLFAGEYEDLVKRVKDGDLKVDFRGLRFACLKAKNCDAEGLSDTKKDMWVAYNAGKYDKAATAAEKLIDEGFVNIEAHMLASMAYDKLNDTKNATSHHDIANGLLQSIFSSGDGKSKETAFEVICVAEEYTMMSVMGLPRIGEQSLATGKPHNYDVLSRTDPKTGKKIVVYFNIDAFFGKGF